jgi:hypothetical protein
MSYIVEGLFYFRAYHFESRAVYSRGNFIKNKIGMRKLAAWWAFFHIKNFKEVFTMSKNSIKEQIEQARSVAKRKSQELNFRFHNPNTSEETVEFLVKELPRMVYNSQVAKQKQLAEQER